MLFCAAGSWNCYPVVWFQGPCGCGTQRCKVCFVSCMAYYILYSRPYLMYLRRTSTLARRIDNFCLDCTDSRYLLSHLIVKTFG